MPCDCSSTEGLTSMPRTVVANRRLMSAAVRGRTEVVAWLLEKGADVRAADKAGNTALADAVWCGFPQVVRTASEERR